MEDEPGHNKEGIDKFTKFLLVIGGIFLGLTLYVYYHIITAKPTVIKDEPVTPIVYDVTADLPPLMPLYLQDDPQWASLPYSSSTIKEAGCGLTAAAMSYEYLTGEQVTPESLLLEVGDSCLTDGVNDMGKFNTYAESRWPNIKGSDIYWDLDGAIKDLRAGKLVYASLTGQFGSRNYGGHIILLWKIDGGTVYIRDPDSGDNSQRSFSVEELKQCNLPYFYSIERVD